MRDDLLPALDAFEPLLTSRAKGSQHTADLWEALTVIEAVLPDNLHTYHLWLATGSPDAAHRIRWLQHLLPWIRKVALLQRTPMAARNAASISSARPVASR